MRLTGLQTPCLVLDQGVLRRNLERMSARARQHGLSLRPHLKTAKSAQVAKLATRGEAGGITVSTLAEAEYFASHGFHDILYAQGITPQKLPRAASLHASGVDLKLITDSAAGARAVSESATAFGVLIEIDSGDARAGVASDSGDLIEIAAILGDRLQGVLTHAGHSYNCRTVAAVRQVAEDERNAVTAAAARLRSAGFRCDIVSLGSTPTATHGTSFEGVTEMRPGVYMFGDLFQAEIQSCSREDIALTVLASVIGHRPADNMLLLDTGALALSKDRSTQGTEHDAGFGLVWDIQGAPALGECRVERAYQEHGVARGEVPLPFRELSLGSKVRIAPNHACITAAAHDRYYVVDGDDEVIAEWDRVNGW